MKRIINSGDRYYVEWGIVPTTLRYALYLNDRLFNDRNIDIIFLSTGPYAIDKFSINALAACLEKQHNTDYERYKHLVNEYLE